MQDDGASLVQIGASSGSLSIAFGSKSWSGFFQKLGFGIDYPFSEMSMYECLITEQLGEVLNVGIGDQVSVNGIMDWNQLNVVIDIYNEYALNKTKNGDKK